MPEITEVKKHDVLIIGAGIAGLRAALQIVDTQDVALITKVHPLRSPSGTNTEGIAAALDKKDSWTEHVKDTIVASKFLADQDAVEKLCREAPDAMTELENWGAIFQKTKDTTYALQNQDAHTNARIAHMQDSTGHMILHTLYQQLTRHKLKLYNEHIVTKLIVEDNQIKGAIALDIATGKLFGIAAKAIILATGGCGQVYKTTTNAQTATGDGIALAFREGAVLKDMEFMQFHPLTLPHTHRRLPLALLSEGGILINWRSQPFLNKYNEKEKPTQNIISYAIAHEEQLSKNNIKLDLRHINIDNYPFLTRLLATSKQDPKQHSITVESAQHRILGGIATTTQTTTDIDGLFAAGECACLSIDGANGLIGNDLTQDLVFGKCAAEQAKEYVRHKKELGTQEYIALRIGLRDNKEIMDNWFQKKDGEQVIEIREKIQETMDAAAGIIRTKKDIEKAKETISMLKEKYANISLTNKSKVYNQEFVNAITTGFLLDVASAILSAACAREESRGTHIVKEYKTSDNKDWLKHILLRYRSDGPELLSESVRITRYKPS